MSFQKSTNELKQEVLHICGELTDGNSQFDSIVVDRLNDLYQGLLAGGNEFGIDVGEPWTWAHAKYPILLQLEAAFDTGTLTLTNSSRVATLSDLPTASMVGRFIKLESQADLYRVTTQSGTTLYLDQPYIGSTGTYNFEAIKLDYDLLDDTIVVDANNKYLSFRENSSSTLSATLTEGTYNTTTFCTEVKTQMEVVGSATYVVSYDLNTRKFTITSDQAYLDLYFASGYFPTQSCSELLGFDLDDYTGATSYTSDYAFNAITRITKPISMYREAPSYVTSANDTGKIFAIDPLTFLKAYPLSRLRTDVPDRFCIIEETNSGLKKIRFNASVGEDMRVEVSYIPVTRRLIDNAYSYPKIPGIHSKYLVYGAAHFLMLDKSDNRADLYKNLAVAKLQAMIADNRKVLSLGGQNFGRLIPRRGHVRTWNYQGRG